MTVALDHSKLRALSAEAERVIAQGRRDAWQSFLDEPGALTDRLTVIGANDLQPRRGSAAAHALRLGRPWSWAQDFAKRAPPSHELWCSWWRTAACGGNLPAVRALLKQAPQARSDPDWVPVLNVFAAALPQLPCRHRGQARAMVHRLVQAGCDPNEIGLDDLPVFHQAIDALLEARRTLGAELSTWALEAIQALLEVGADPSVVWPETDRALFEHAALSGLYGQVLSLLPWSAASAPNLLHDAICNSVPRDTLEALVAVGYEWHVPGPSGRTPAEALCTDHAEPWAAAWGESLRLERHVPRAPSSPSGSRL